jgi:hypothetical protein
MSDPKFIAEMVTFVQSGEVGELISRALLRMEGLDCRRACIHLLDIVSENVEKDFEPRVLKLVAPKGVGTLVVRLLDAIGEDNQIFAVGRLGPEGTGLARDSETVLKFRPEMSASDRELFRSLVRAGLNRSPPIA